ncbi:MAG: hypothetical protein EZS28_007535 [Streblomastix strix]|uniref:Uncharacterized protein n=1 Tax=Streblomastix strix TaxID=222440 RepID=A0A5J4WS69_9EUKA|nr:MAG: hypothetical protein EZS28_007535 [Streblomastix strix]
MIVFKEQMYEEEMIRKRVDMIWDKKGIKNSNKKSRKNVNINNEEIISIEELQNHKRKLSSNEIKSELDFWNQKKALRIKQENNEQEDAAKKEEVRKQKFAPLLLFASGNSGHNCELESVIWQRTLSQHGTGALIIYCIDGFGVSHYLPGNSCPVSNSPDMTRIFLIGCKFISLHGDISNVFDMDGEMTDIENGYLCTPQVKLVLRQNTFSRETVSDSSEVIQQPICNPYLCCKLADICFVATEVSDNRPEVFIHPGCGRFLYFSLPYFVYEYDKFNATHEYHLDNYYSGKDCRATFTQPDFTGTLQWMDQATTPFFVGGVCQYVNVSDGSYSDFEDVYELNDTDINSLDDPDLEILNPVIESTDDTDEDKVLDAKINNINFYFNQFSPYLATSTIIQINDCQTIYAESCLTQNIGKVVIKSQYQSPQLTPRANLKPKGRKTTQNLYNPQFSTSNADSIPVAFDQLSNALKRTQRNTKKKNESTGDLFTPLISLSGNANMTVEWMNIWHFSQDTDEPLIFIQQLALIQLNSVVFMKSNLTVDNTSSTAAQQQANIDTKKSPFIYAVNGGIIMNSTQITAIQLYNVPVIQVFAINQRDSLESGGIGFEYDDSTSTGSQEYFQQLVMNNGSSIIGVNQTTNSTNGVSMIEAVGYDVTIIDSILQGTDFTVIDTSNKTDTQNGSTKAQTKKMKNLRNFIDSQIYSHKNADNTTAQNQTQTPSQDLLIVDEGDPTCSWSTSSIKFKQGKLNIQGNTKLIDLGIGALHIGYQSEVQIDSSVIFEGNTQYRNTDGSIHGAQRKNILCYGDINTELKDIEAEEGLEQSNSQTNSSFISQLQSHSRKYMNDFTSTVKVNVNSFRDRSIQQESQKATLINKAQNMINKQIKKNSIFKSIFNWLQSSKTSSSSSLSSISSSQLSNITPTPSTNADAGTGGINYEGLWILNDEFCDVQLEGGDNVKSLFFEPKLDGVSGSENKKKNGMNFKISGTKLVKCSSIWLEMCRGDDGEIKQEMNMNQFDDFDERSYKYNKYDKYDKEANAYRKKYNLPVNAKFHEIEITKDGKIMSKSEYNNNLNLNQNSQYYNFRINAAANTSQNTSQTNSTNATKETQDDYIQKYSINIESKCLRVLLENANPAVQVWNDDETEISFSDMPYDGFVFGKGRTMHVRLRFSDGKPDTIIKTKERILRLQQAQNVTDQKMNKDQIMNDDVVDQDQVAEQEFFTMLQRSSTYDMKTGPWMSVAEIVGLVIGVLFILVVGITALIVCIQSRRHSLESKVKDQQKEKEKQIKEQEQKDKEIKEKQQKEIENKLKEQKVIEMKEIQNTVIQNQVNVVQSQLAQGSSVTGTQGALLGATQTNTLNIVQKAVIIPPQQQTTIIGNVGANTNTIPTDAWASGQQQLNQTTGAIISNIQPAQINISNNLNLANKADNQITAQQLMDQVAAAAASSSLAVFPSAIPLNNQTNAGNTNESDILKVMMNNNNINNNSNNLSDANLQAKQAAASLALQQSADEKSLKPIMTVVTGNVGNVASQQISDMSNAIPDQIPSSTAFASQLMEQISSVSGGKVAMPPQSPSSNNPDQFVQTKKTVVSTNVQQTTSQIQNDILNKTNNAVINNIQSAQNYANDFTPSLPQMVDTKPISIQPVIISLPPSDTIIQQQQQQQLVKEQLSMTSGSSQQSTARLVQQTPKQGSNIKPRVQRKKLNAQSSQSALPPTSPSGPQSSNSGNEGV